MREDELIALVPTIVEELTSMQLRNDLEQLDFILCDLLAEDKGAAYGALGMLEDLLADITELPEHSTLSAEEWDARRTDFCRAAELYLDARWEQSSGDKSH